MKTDQEMVRWALEESSEPIIKNPYLRSMFAENPALTQEQFKAGGIVEPGVTHYAKKEGVGKGGNPASWGHRKIDVDLNKIIKLRKKKLTLTQIANELNVSKSRINTAVAEAKLPKVSSHKDTSFTLPADIDVAEVKRLRAEGKTYTEITKELNVSESTLDRLVRGRVPGGEKIPRTFVTGEIRKVLDSFLAEGKTSFTTSDIIKKLPEKFVLEDYHTAMTQVKKEKKYNKLKFKRAENWFIKPAEDIKKVASLIDEGKTLAEIERETGFHYKFINRVETQNKLKMPKNLRDRYINIQRITADIEKLANDNKIKDAFRVGKVDKNLLTRAGTVLKSDDVFRDSRTLFKLAEYYDGSLEAYYKVNLPKPTKNQIEGSKKIIRSAARFKDRRSGYAFDKLLYDYGGKKVDKILDLRPGTFLKIQKEIAETLPRKIGVDEVFGIKSSGRYAPVQAVLINPLKSTLNVEKSGVDSFKSAYHDQLKEASNIKNKAERITEQKRILKEYRTTLKKWKNDPRYKNVEFPDFEIGKHPSKTIKNWAELGPAIKKQLIADYKATDISPKATKARNIFQMAEEVGSETWKGLDPKIKNSLIIAKTAKGPAKLKAMQLVIGTIGTAAAASLFTKFGITPATADTGAVSSDVSEAGMKVPTVGQTVTAGALSKLSGKLGGTDPLKYFRKVPRKILSALGTPTGAVAAWPLAAMGMKKAGWMEEDTPAFDIKSTGDRIGAEAELALAPTLVSWTDKLTKPIKNKAVRAGVTRLLNLGMSPAMAFRAARVASPIGLLSLAGEGIYHAGKKEMARREQMSPQELEDFHLERQSRGWSRMGRADGGIVSLLKK